MTLDEKILQKVRGLLAMAENPAATEAEAQAFSEKAEELIGRYAIDTALLEAKEHKGKPTSRRYNMPTPYPKPKTSLLTGIARAYGCQVIRTHRDGGGLVVFGYQSDLDVIDVLYTSLLLQALHGMQQQYLSDRSFRTSYWYGFAAKVSQRLKERQEALVAEVVRESDDPIAASTALVLADRSKEVDSAVAEMFPRLRTSAPGRATSASGWSAGQTVGANANLGNNSIQTSRKALV